MAFSDRILIGALAWGALAFGAVYPWAYWPLAAVCAGLGLWAVAKAEAWTDRRTRTLALALAAVAAAIAIQLIALPYGLLDRLSPAVDRFLREFRIAYRPEATHSLSIAPAATFAAFGLFVAFALLLVGYSVALRRSRLEWIVVQLMWLGVGLAIFGIIQHALFPAGPEKLVYGFWRPQQAGNPFGPFIDRNHFAGWMVMVLPLVVGYSCAVAVRAPKPRQRGAGRWLRWATTVESGRLVLVAFAAAVMGMALVLTGSRSGIAAFAVSMAVFGILAMGRGANRRTRLLVPVYAAVFVVAAIVWAGTDTTVTRFLLARRDAASRLSAWRDTVHIIEDFPVFGTGLGGYERAMLVYQTSGREFIYAQAHNDYLQVAAEGGLLVGVPAAFAGVLILFTIRRRLRNGDDRPVVAWTRIGAVAGLGGIAAQSFVEFSLQMPGNTAMCAVLIAIALHRGRQMASPRAEHADRV